MGTLEQVQEGEVPAELAGTYRDIRRTLRTSYVPLLFRALAVHRGVLRSLWKQLKPNAATRAFEEASDDLRAHLARAAVDLGTPLIEPVLSAAGFDVDELDELRDQVSIFHYTDPKLLLSAAALSRALGGQKVGGYRVRPELLVETPAVPADELPQLMLLPEEPGGIAGEIFHEILASTHLPVAPVDLRAIGHWPAFLEAAWREVGPVFRHRALPDALRAISQEADELALHLPYPISLGPEALGEAYKSLPAIARIVTMMADSAPRLALFAAALKVALDGAQDALDSPHPVEWDEEAAELMPF